MPVMSLIDRAFWIVTEEGLQDMIMTIYSKAWNTKFPWLKRGTVNRRKIGGAAV